MGGNRVSFLWTGRHSPAKNSEKPLRERFISNITKHDQLCRALTLLCLSLWILLQRGYCQSLIELSEKKITTGPDECKGRKRQAGHLIISTSYGIGGAEVAQLREHSPPIMVILARVRILDLALKWCLGFLSVLVLARMVSVIQILRFSSLNKTQLPKFKFHFDARTLCNGLLKVFLCYVDK